MKNALIVKFCILCLIICLPYIGTSQVTIVKDINTQTALVGTSLSSMVELNGVLFFTFNDAINGSELWKSDGTEAGTVLVKDIRLGKFSSSPQGLININGTIFFAADDGVHGSELWKSDGTEAGTVMVKNINIASSSSSPSNFTDVNGTLFFAAGDGVHGRELWKSDGTEAGTVMVKNISENIYDYAGNMTFLQSLTNVNGTLFFTANDGVSGSELWKSDGTETGTIMVKNIGIVGESNIKKLIDVGGTLFFTRYLGAGYEQLWKSDGTEVGTVLVKNLPSSSVTYESVNNLVVLNNILFFTFDNYINGQELWKSDGTEAGTVMVKDIRPGSLGACYQTNKIIVLNNHIYFRAYNEITGGELWKSDGTEAGTVMVKDIRSGSGSSGSNDLPIINVNGTLFFSAAGSSNGAGIENIELWKSDGTEAGTLMVKDIRQGVWSSWISSFIQIGSEVFFTADDGVHGRELWKSDGTEVGTVMIRDRADANSSGMTGYYSGFATINNNTFFIADDGIHGRELWKSDGTEANTILVKDIQLGTGSSDFITVGKNEYWLTSVNGTLFFAASNSLNGNELWKSDGTEAGTIMVKDIYNMPNNSNGPSEPRYLTNVNGTLFFTANDGVHRRELWKSDGTDAGTVMVKDIYNVQSNPNHTSEPKYLTNVNGTLFFAADDGTGSELWKSDGTEAGTVMVKNISPGASSPTNLVVSNNTLFFTADNGVNGVELWKSDGTEAGTVMVKDIKTGTTSSYPSYLTNVNGTVFFVIYTGVGYRELWKSDGTEAGTRRVKDFSEISFNKIENLVAVNNTLFFYIEKVGSTELWKSDGTETGTVMVKSIFMANPFVTPNGELFFKSSDGIHGAELWKSDGTEAGTMMVADVYLGATGSNATPVAYINGAVLFTAYSYSNGEELWKTLPCLPISLTPDLSSGFVNSSYNQYVTQTGLTGIVVWETMGLPLGLSMNANTGEISGTPTVAGTFNITITVKSGSCSAIKNYTLVINCPTITFNNAIANNATVGTLYNLDASVNVIGNSNPVTYSVIPSLPTGLILNPSTGQISGIPTKPIPANIYTVRASQNSGCFRIQTYSFAVVCPNMTINGTLPNGMADVPYSASLMVVNSPISPIWSVTNLPNGLSINTNTGEISGIPTVAGTFNITITVKSSGCTTSKNYSLVVGCPMITFNNISIPNTAVVGTPYSFDASVSVVGNSSPIIYSMLSFLPSGLAINPSTGQISGIPRSSQSMDGYTVKASQSNGCFKLYTYSFAVVCPNTIINGVPPNGVVSAFYSTTFTSSGSPISPIWSATNLPNGLSMNANTGEISGIPTTLGTFNITITTNIYNCLKNQNYTLVINCPTINFNNTIASNAIVGTPYNLDASVNVVGNSNPVIYSVTPSLPSGLTLNSSTGQISGIPTKPMSANTYRVRASQSDGCFRMQTYSFAVVCPNMTINGTLSNGFVDVFYNASFTISDSSSSPIWSATNLPDGLSMNANTGEISGIPTTLGTFNITITAQVYECVSSQNYTLSINIIEASKSIQLYPVPTNSEINIEVKDWRSYEWNIKNIFGQTLKTGSFEGKILKIELKDMIPGSYILEFKNKELIRTRRFVKI